MSYRFMRIIVFFDLPTLTAENRREYRHFVKSLLKKGFIMMQESVYCRMALNKTISDAIVQNLRQNRPPDGVVQILIITEKQFQKMEFLIGEYNTDIVDSDERIVFI